MKSPNGLYEVITHGYGEIRMGSPWFGTIQLKGATIATDGTFGEPMAFSCDSRYLALEQLIDTKAGPHVNAVVLDLMTNGKQVVHDQNPGLIKSFEWTEDGSLKVVVWSHTAGDSLKRWHPNPAG